MFGVAGALHDRFAFCNIKVVPKMDDPLYVSRLEGYLEDGGGERPEMVHRPAAASVQFFPAVQERAGGQCRAERP